MSQAETYPPLVVVIGPTGIGKTSLVVALAEQISLQVISADSRQIYQGMHIGTASPTPAEQLAAPHHLVNVVPPDYVLTLAEFQERAYQAIEAVHTAGEVPFLVGGTGQWVQAVVQGWGIPRVPPDWTLRAELEAQAEAEGAETLHAELAEVDPPTAAKLDYRNVRRVVRALEVYRKTDIPISVHQEKKPPPYRILQLGLTMPREVLYLRIDKRIERMLAEGLLDEVEALLTAGYGWDLPAMSGLGYRQLGGYVRGEISLGEAEALIKKETRRFIRQQYNWFRRAGEGVRWFDVTEAGVETAVLGVVQAFLEG